MKAVVTGAAGFIGSHLTERLLADGFEVWGVDAFVPYYPRAIKEQNLAPARGHDQFRLIEGALQEINLGEVLEGATHVYHLAAQAGVRASWGSEFEIYVRHNVLATQRLLEASVAARVPRLVYASSSSVYGQTTALPLSEDAVCHPLSPYGVTKLAAEHLGFLYHHAHALPVVSLRYFTVYGPRQRPDMAFHRFLRAALEGGSVMLYGDGEQTRDFTFVTDVVNATVRAADQGHPGRVYNVGGKRRVTINDVLRLVERVTGRTLRVAHDEAQRGDMRDTFADTSAAERDLAFRSTVSLEEGLQLEWEWLKRAV